MKIIEQRLLSLSILVAGLGLYFPWYKQVYEKYQYRQAYSNCFKSKLAEPTKFGKSYNADSPRTDKPYKGDLSEGVPFTTRHMYDNALPRNLVSQVGLAVSPDGKTVYELTDNGIKARDRITNIEEYFELPPSFPRLSWGTDIAYDSKRDLVSLVSFGGEGFFYRFDVKQGKWLDFSSVHNIDIQSLTYDRTLDRYLAWANGSLLTMSETGNFLSQDRIIDKMAGFYQLYDRGNESVPVVEIAANGNNLTLITHSSSSVRSIWHYDYDAKTAQLTYKAN